MMNDELAQCLNGAKNMNINFLRYSCSAAFLLVCLVFATLATPLCAAPLALHTSGSVLYNSAGAPVVLKGVDICSLEWDSHGDHLLQSVDVAIHKWHVSLIRLPISQDFWEGHGGLTDGGAAYHALIDRVVATASKNNVYVLVDMHWSDMGHWDTNIQQHDLPDDNTATAWHDVATHFANNPGVLFDAYNEPHDVTWDLWRNGGSVTEGSTTYHSAGMQGIVDVIRATGANNVITVGGLDFAYDLTGIAKGYAITGKNIMYSTHIYPASDPNWDANVTVASAFGPIYVGEFGADPTNAYAQFEPRILAWITAHHYSATAWCMHTSATPCLIKDWNYTPTFNEGTYVYNWLTGGPTAPLGVQTTGTGGHITVSWDKVPGANSYVVYRSAAPNHELDAPPIATGVSQPDYVDASATNGATYYYRVAAVSNRGTSGVSDDMGATAGVARSFAPPTPSFDLLASASPSTTTANTPMIITVSATNSSQALASAILIAMQVVGPGGPAQQTKDDPGIDPGQTKSFTFTFTPATAGTYKISVGVFGAGWSPHYNWDSNLATITVN
jgi:endoglucanase